jgi:hypothetical protein
MAKAKISPFSWTLAAHSDQWVALNLHEERIIASGKTLEEVQRKVTEKNEKDYVFHLVPSKAFI